MKVKGLRDATKNALTLDVVTAEWAQKLGRDLWQVVTSTWGDKNKV